MGKNRSLAEHGIGEMFRVKFGDRTGAGDAWQLPVCFWYAYHALVDVGVAVVVFGREAGAQK